MSTSAPHAMTAWRMAAAGAAACFAVSASAIAATGGTITFRGALVAPTFATVATFAHAAPDGGGFSTRQNETGQTTVIAFSALPDSSTIGQISLTTDNQKPAFDAVSTRFADGNGKRIDATGGQFHVGASGGVLTIQKKRPSAARMTLLTSYQ